MTATTINFKGINLVVQGTYTKGEGQIMYCDDMSGYPGSASSFVCHKIFVEDSNIDIWSLFYDGDLEEMELLAIEEIEK